MATKTDRARVNARQMDTDMWDWLSGGLGREDGRLALFDRYGEPVDRAIVKTAIREGLAKPWFANPMNPQWTVCRLTQKGCDAVVRSDATR